MKTEDNPLKCDLCHKEFTCSYYLAVHKPIYSSEKPFRCDICKKAFTQSDNLTKHKQIHSEKKHLIVIYVKKQLLNPAINYT
jgi:uncharacterized Zn-finger protein